MSRRTDGDLQTLYERTAREFAKRVCQQYGGVVHSIVLYGSVARKEAGRDSDIDLMVLTDEGEALFMRLMEITEELDSQNNYVTYLSPVPVTPKRLEEMKLGGYPIADDVLTEGDALYDDGTFRRVRENALATG